MRGAFVTGTDTGVGKTRVAAALLCAYARAGLRTAGMKPVASGALSMPEGLRNEDALALQAAAALAKPYELVNPYVFAPPIAPHIAAREAGIGIELAVILRACRELCVGADAVVVEGVGGWQVPLSETLALPDLARALALPVVLVVGLRLGCLNHAQLTARAVRADGLRLAGWVANGVDPQFARREANLAALAERLDAPLLGVLPWEPQAEAARVAERLRIEPLLEAEA